MLVLRWSQRAHYWFLGRPKGHIRGPKGHSALWKRPSENAGGNALSCEQTLLLRFNQPGDCIWLLEQKSVTKLYLKMLLEVKLKGIFK